MKKSKIRGISIPMHILCGKDVYTPVQGNVFFENGYMYATNAFMAVRASIKEHTGFNEDEIKLLNGKQISAANFLKLYSCGVLFVRENGIEDTSNGVLYKFKESEKYPDFLCFAEKSGFEDGSHIKIRQKNIIKEQDNLFD